MVIWILSFKKLLNFFINLLNFINEFTNFESSLKSKNSFQLIMINFFSHAFRFYFYYMLYIPWVFSFKDIDNESVVLYFENIYQCYAHSIKRYVINLPYSSMLLRRLNSFRIIWNLKVWLNSSKITTNWLFWGHDKLWEVFNFLTWVWVFKFFLSLLGSVW